MPKLSVWYVRASLVYLGLGATFGAVMLSHKGIPWAPWAWTLLVSHIDVALFGWVTFLAMGIAYWILPRFGVRRGREGWARTALYSMNAGLFLVIVAPWLPAEPAILLIGRTLEVLAVVAFVVHAWPRVKPLMVSSGDLDALAKRRKQRRPKA
jgi:hypothetical protein